MQVGIQFIEGIWVLQAGHLEPMTRLAVDNTLSDDEINIFNYNYGAIPFAVAHCNWSGG